MQKNRTQFLTLLASDCSLDSTTRLALGESSPTPEAVIFFQRVPPLHLSPFPSPRCGAHNSQEGGRTLFELENVHVERGARGLMGLTSPSQAADIKKKDSFNWNSLGSQCLGPIPVEEGYIDTGRCSGAWLDTVRDWGLPVEDEATLHLPDRKPREARGRRGR